MGSEERFHILQHVEGESWGTPFQDTFFLFFSHKGTEAILVAMIPCDFMPQFPPEKRAFFGHDIQKCVFWGAT